MSSEEKKRPRTALEWAYLLAERSDLESGWHKKYGSAVDASVIERERQEIAQKIEDFKREEEQRRARLY